MTARPAFRAFLLAAILIAAAACAGLEDPSLQTPQATEMDVSPLATPQITETVISPLSTPSGSGVEGQVWIGPTCPGAQVGTECPDKPYEAQLTITDLDGRVVARGQSGTDGFFQIPLAPGDYVLVPESPNPDIPPYARPIPFNVSPGVLTQLAVTYDSGIR